MNETEFNSLYEQKRKSLSPYFDSQAQGDKDKLQDLYLGLLLGLKQDPYATNTYLMKRARWNMLNNLRRNTSLLDTYQFSLSEPSESQKSDFLDIIIFQDFLASLTLDSRKYAQCKLRGIPSSKIQSQLEYSDSDVRKIKKEISERFEEFYLS